MTVMWRTISIYPLLCPSNLTYHFNIFENDIIYNQFNLRQGKASHTLNGNKTMLLYVHVYFGWKEKACECDDDRGRESTLPTKAKTPLTIPGLCSLSSVNMRYLTSLITVHSQPPIEPFKTCISTRDQDHPVHYEQ